MNSVTCITAVLSGNFIWTRSNLERRVFKSATRITSSYAIALAMYFAASDWLSRVAPIKSIISDRRSDTPCRNRHPDSQQRLEDRRGSCPEPLSRDETGVKPIPFTAQSRWPLDWGQLLACCPQSLRHPGLIHPFSQCQILRRRLSNWPLPPDRGSRPQNHREKEAPDPANTKREAEITEPFSVATFSRSCRISLCAATSAAAWTSSGPIMPSPEQFFCNRNHLCRPINVVRSVTKPRMMATRFPSVQHR